MNHFIKRTLFIVDGTLSELLVIPLLLLLCVAAKIIYSKKNTIFFGMMHINNLTYVAKTMRLKGYTVQVVPFMIPEHEVDVIPYDVNLKRKYPLLYSHFIGQYILTFWIFIWSIFNFHIFVMPFRTRILDRAVWLKFFEIPLLHLAGKKVILNTYGGDVATPRLKRRHDLKYSLYEGYMADPQYRAYDEEAIARNTRKLEKQADYIISAIDHVDYLERVDEYFHLRCIDTQSIHPNYNVQNQIPVFVHAPNHRLIKGTDKIIEVIDSLNKRGFPCELKIVENTSNAELLKIIKESDGVIDQLLLGTYARLAIEAMALGKPVFCYLRQDLYKFNPIWTDCPIINVDPDNLEQKLELFLKSTSEERLKVGIKSRKYIEKYHSLEYVGSRFNSIIQKVLKS
ncbi:MAG: hypothetical protein ACD_21C00250G0044 [uncultured bacterium]|nr:MAG: hypothetical protein ACD_21C00250G0044 [uncultured bacterium]